MTQMADRDEHQCADGLAAGRPRERTVFGGHCMWPTGTAMAQSSRRTRRVRFPALN